MTRQKPLDYVPVDVLIFDSPKMRRFCAMFTPRRKWQCQIAVLRLLCYAGLHAPDGDLGNITPKELKAACDWSGKGPELMDALVASKWLLRTQYGAISVVKWSHYGGRALALREQWRSTKQTQRNKNDDLPDDVLKTSTECLTTSKDKVKLKSNRTLPDITSPPTDTQIADEKRQRLVSLRGFSDIKRDAIFSRAEVEAMMTDEGWHLRGYGGPKRQDNRLRLSELGEQMGARLIKAANITRKGSNPNATYFITTLENLRKRAMFPTPEQVRVPNYQPLYHECTPAELAIRRGEPPPGSSPDNADGPQRSENDSSDEVDDKNPFGAIGALFGRPDLVGGT